MLQPILKAGLSQGASDALRRAKITRSQITQTIGNAAASAGTHAKDGMDAFGKSYAACVDISVKYPTLLDDATVVYLLQKLWKAGFIAWYRKPGYDGWPGNEARHVHAIWPGVYMKPVVQRQAKDFFEGKNGLASHVAYKFFKVAAPSSEELDAMKELYYANNPLSPGGTPPMPDKDILKLGSSGPKVKELQEQLKFLGYYTVAVDGSFGPKTADAVAAFQAAYEISVTRQVGATTAAKLNQVAP